MSTRRYSLRRALPDGTKNRVEMRAGRTTPGALRILGAAIIFWAPNIVVAQTQSSNMPSQSPDGTARALLSAAHEASLTSDGPLLIDRILVDLGDRFQKDDPLIEFDCTLRRARVTAAEGVRKGALAKLDSKMRLVRTRTIGALEGELARADAQKAEGEFAEAQDAAERCVIRAPFAGHVAKRQANEHEVVGPDRQLVSIVSDGPLRVTTIVPSVWMRWLKTGTPFDVAVDETGKVYRAKVVAISGRVDAASQSIELLGRIEDQPAELLPGMSGEARFEPPSTPQ